MAACAQDIKPGDLQRVAVLGAGAFGQVCSAFCTRRARRMRHRLRDCLTFACHDAGGCLAPLSDILNGESHRGILRFKQSCFGSEALGTSHACKQSAHHSTRLPVRHKQAELPQVMLVKHAGKYYALKTLHKAQIIDMGLHVRPAPHASV